MDSYLPTILFCFCHFQGKKSLVFTKLLSDLPIINPKEIAHDPLLDEFVYLIDFTDPSYGDILIYLQAQCFHPELSSNDRRRIRHQEWNYLVLNDTLYHHGVDTFL